MTDAVIGGVDTHSAVHHAAAIDTTGQMLGTAEFPATPSGYEQLQGWLESHGVIVAVGVEGTGAYGAGLARHLHAAGIEVVEVPRPNRQQRRLRGKSDALDAEAATPRRPGRHRDHPPQARRRPHRGDPEPPRGPSRSHQGKDRCHQHPPIDDHHAPEPLRSQLPAHGLPNKIIDACSKLRPDPHRIHEPLHDTKAALRSIAQRARALRDEIKTLDHQLAALLRAYAPNTLDVFAMGPDTVAALLVTIGDNPDRLRSEAAFARLCGVAPIPASSGKTTRHRLHRGGDRSANRALHHRRHRPTPLLRPHTRLRPTPHRRRSNETRDHPLPQALPRARDLPHPTQRLPSPHQPDLIYRSVLRDLPQRVNLKLLVSDDPLQPGVLPLKLLQPLRVVGFQPPVLSAPACQRRLRHLQMLGYLSELTPSPRSRSASRSLRMI